MHVQEGRDHWWHELMQDAARRRASREPIDTEHPLFILYTSGTTGQAEGHRAHDRRLPGRHATPTTKWVFDLKDDDIYWCTADIGWVTGHSYVVYGPLAERRDRRDVRRALPTGPTKAASGR